MKKYFSPGYIAAIGCFLFVNSCLFAQTGTWTKIADTAPHYNMGACLLMTDGTVICHNTSGGGEGTGWDRLTPDASGSYINGTWDSIASMNYDRLFFSSQVLPSGKVYAAGGEYGAGGTTGEVYDPVANTWTTCGAIPSGWNIYDGNSELLYDGTVLEGPQIGSSNSSTDILIWSPVTLNYTVAPNSLYNHDEAQWLKLRDSSVLFVGIESVNSNRYIPQTGNWVNDGTVLGDIFDPGGEESGCGTLLPNRQAIFFGATGYNAFYTPTNNSNPGTWTTADSFPVIGGYRVGQPDASGAMMVNGHELLAVSQLGTSAGEFGYPTFFVEYNYVTNSFTQVTTPLPGIGDSIPGTSSFQTQMLDLPDGNVLLSISQTSSYSTSYFIYTPGSAPIPQGKPTINSILPDGCPFYKITGKLFNGISEGASYGDDWEMATNYPLVRLTNGSNVYYCKTTNWNRLGAVMTDSLEDTAVFETPAALPAGTYSLYVVVNGFASNPTLFTTLGITAAATEATNGNCNGSASAAVSGGIPPYTYSWTGGLTTDTISNQCSGTYCATVTDANGCIDSVCVTINAVTGTNKIIANNGELIVYPNPNNGLFTLEATLVNGKSSLEIYDVLGQNIMTREIVNKSSEINLSTKASGVYFYRLIKDDGSLIGKGKIVIQK